MRFPSNALSGDESHRSSVQTNMNANVNKNVNAGTGEQANGAFAHNPSSSPSPLEQKWRDLVSDIGSEIAGPLTSALERIHALTSSGRIDKAGLRALGDEIAAARQVGLNAQQLIRFSSGRLRQSHERVPLAATVGAMLNHRSRETLARGIVLQPTLKPVDVIVDASLLFSLLNVTLDWVLAQAESHIAFNVDTKVWPANGRVTCRFLRRKNGNQVDPQTPAASAPAEVDSSTQSLSWRLIEQTASTMGLLLAHSQENGVTTLSFEFPRTASEDMEGVGATEMDDGFSTPSAMNSKPLAGSHVLVVASRRDVRVQVRDAIKHMGLIIDLVASVEEAVDFCQDGLPHAIVVESILAGARLNQLKAEICGEVPGFAFIEIVEEGNSFEMSNFDQASMARVGRAAIESALPSVLTFELSKSL